MLPLFVSSFLFSETSWQFVCIMTVSDYTVSLTLCISTYVAEDYKNLLNTLFSIAT